MPRKPRSSSPGVIFEEIPREECFCCNRGLEEKAKAFREAHPRTLFDCHVFHPHQLTHPLAYIPYIVNPTIKYFLIDRDRKNQLAGQLPPDYYTARRFWEECDKSFTRSDALAKHMRIQHKLAPETNRMRKARLKREAKDAELKQLEQKYRDEYTASKATQGQNGGANAAAADMTGDALGDELLELAGGDATSNGVTQFQSLAEVEDSLSVRGAKSAAFTYANLFGAGAEAMFRADDSQQAALADEELGIERDTVESSGPFVDDDYPDEQLQLRDNTEMQSVLEVGRRAWIERERARAVDRPSPEPFQAKETGDAGQQSEEDELMQTEPMPAKRGRRSKAQAASADALAGSIDLPTLKRLYLVEKAKLRKAREDNERMRADLKQCRELERQEKIAKRRCLEMALEKELGNVVSAIFTPPASP